jgi:Cortactin-binding protein-2
MLSRAKYGWSDVSDPVTALQRDSDLVKDSESEDAAIRGIYGNQLMQLERLISTQRVAQQQMRDQLVAVERQYHRVGIILKSCKVDKLLNETWVGSHYFIRLWYMNK